MHALRVNFPNSYENHTFLFVLTYKSEFFSLLRFRQPQRLYLPGGLEKNFSVMIIPRELQHISTAVPRKFCWQHQKVVANCLYGGCRISFWQAQPLKPMNKIVPQEEQLQKCHVGHPLLGRNFV